MLGTANVVQGHQGGRRQAARSTSRRRSATASSRWSSRSRSTTRSARGQQLRDQQDRRRAVRRPERPRLHLVPPGQRLRPAQPQRPAADLLPAADDRQAVLRHGHAARLHLHRRPRRRRREGHRRRRAAAAPTTSRPARDYAIKELFDATVEGARHQARRATVEVRDRATRTTRSRSCSTRRRRSEDFGWKATTPLEEGVAPGDRVLPRVRHQRDLHAPQGWPSECSRRSERLRRTRRCSSSAAPGFVGSNLVRGAARARRGARCSSSTTCSRPSARTCPTTAGHVRRGLDRRRRACWRSSTTTSTTSSTWRTYHGNQNSIADPLADHENNLLTTLKLFERLKGFSRLQKVVYAGAGCTRRGEDLRRRRGRPPRTRRCRSSSTARTRSPRSSASSTRTTTTSEHGLPAVRARFQNVYGPGEILGAGRVARHAGDGLAERHADVRLPGAQGHAARRSRTAASPRATSSTSRTSSTA